jgi:hypothetical protein
VECVAAVLEMNQDLGGDHSSFETGEKTDILRPLIDIPLLIQASPHTPGIDKLMEK